MQIPNTTQVTPNYSTLFPRRTQEARSGNKHMPLLRARAVHTMTQEVLFLFPLQRKALRVFLPARFSQRTRMPCELFVYEYPKQMSMAHTRQIKLDVHFEFLNILLASQTSLASTLRWHALVSYATVLCVQASLLEAHVACGSLFKVWFWQKGSIALINVA